MTTIDGDERGRSASTSDARPEWRGVLRRTVAESQADAITDRAAALTYYAVLSIFPALIALVSIVGLVGESATKPLLENVNTVAPGPAKDILTSAIQNIASKP